MNMTPACLTRESASAGSARSLAEVSPGLYDLAAMNLISKALSLRAGCVLALASVALGGCSSGLSSVDKRLGDMQEEITKLQSQNDRLVDRVEAMEVRQAKVEQAPKAKPTAQSALASAGGSERPSLKVVKVVPEDTSGMPTPEVGTQAPGDAADDPSPRPVIKLQGSGGKRSDKSESKGEG